MASIINASPTNGLVQTADGSGILKIQSNSVTTNALAWVNFNGQGTVAIRSSYNVSSITDNGTGEFTINFATALSDANYSINVNASMSYGSALIASPSLNTQGGGASELAPSTSSFRIYIAATNTTAFDPKYVNVSVFGN